MRKWQFYIVTFYAWISLWMNMLLAQGWVRQLSGTHHNLNGVSFVDALTGTVVGDSGTILRTTNGGIDWIPQNSGTIKNLRSVAFYDNDNGFAVGDSGLILYTMNAGTIWLQQNSGSFNRLYAISYKSLNSAIIVGKSGLILRTTNKGAAWIPVNSGTYKNLYAVSFIDSIHGYVAGNDGIILRTYNGGTDWIVRADRTGGTLVGVTMVNHTSCYAVYESGSVLFTLNDGWTWNTTSLGSPLRGISSFGSLKCIVGDRIIIKTTKTGYAGDWDQKSLVDCLLNVLITDSRTETAVGTSGTIIRTYSDRWPPPRMTLDYPANNDQNIPFDFSIPPSYAIHFRWYYYPYRTSMFANSIIQIALDSAFNQIVLIRRIWSNWLHSFLAESVLLPNTKYYWKVGMDDGEWQAWSDVWNFTTQNIFTYNIREIQEVPFDYLLIADSLQNTMPSTWTLQTSPHNDFVVRMSVVCVIPPSILSEKNVTNFQTMIVYDSNAMGDTWNGIPVLRLQYGLGIPEIKKGYIFDLIGKIMEYPEKNMNSATRIMYISHTLIDSINIEISPFNVSISDFYEGIYPDGKMKYSTGEKYEGMYVKLSGLTVHSVVSHVDGTFNVSDGSGNILSISDASCWFTLRDHRHESSTYSIPLLGTHIETLRGIVNTQFDSNFPESSRFRIAPVYPSDIVYGSERIGRLKGKVFQDFNNDGIRNIGESGLSGCEIIIGGKIESKINSDKTGEYNFTGLDSGKYIVNVKYPYLWTQTYPHFKSYVITLGLNNTVDGLDFGAYYPWCSVEGVVFHDQDENGIRNQNDRGLNDWEICLIGDQTIYTWTNDNGYFEFTGLLPSVYQIRIGGIERGWEQLTPRDNEGYLIEFRSYGERITNNDFGMKRIPVRVKLKMSVNDNYPKKANLYWGIRPGATYGIWGADPQATYYDFSEGEYDIPPVISGFFDVRFVDPTLSTSRFGLGAYTDMRDFISPTEKYTYRINFVPGRAWGGDYPMTFRWSSLDIQRSFPNGIVELVDKYGSRFDMKTRDSLVITDRSITYLSMVAQGPNISTDYLKSWKMVSLPVDVIDNRAKVIFQIVGSKAFSYFSNLGYLQTDTLVPGIGYWLKCTGQLDSSQFIGPPRFNDTIPIFKGWNMIGTLSVPVPAASITTIPSGLVNGIFFGYSGNYIPTDTIKPFHAYWVKSQGNGDLVLDAWRGAGQKAESKYAAFERLRERCNSLIIQDATNSEQGLYFTTSDDNTDIAFFELPPVPPSELFDVRYGSNRMIEVVEQGKEKEIPIMISSGEYPITLKWRLNSSTVTASLKIDGKEILLRATGSTHISQLTSHISLVLRGVPNIPQEYSLEQNYPNPFNPLTIINYQLPIDNWVSLKIYNLLGQEVATLVDEIQDAGYKSIEWDASGFASGIYIYQFEASSITNPEKAFKQVRKMILIR